MREKFNYLLFLFIFIVYNSLHATNIKIIAKINNQIITNIDLEYRLNLAIEISNIPNEIKFRKQIRQQILNLLIDETLKIQEAEKYGILISSSEVYSEINRLEQRLKLPKEEDGKDVERPQLSYGAGAFGPRTCPGRGKGRG